MKLNLALVRNVMPREKAHAAPTARPKVPMRRAGADCFVVCAGQRMSQEGSSPSGARMRGAVSESGGNASLAGEGWEGMEMSNWARRRKPETDKAELKPSSRSTPEGRVSAARRNPKGMRRSTGP